jgi:hypothetical protein
MGMGCRRPGGPALPSWPQAEYALNMRGGKQNLNVAGRVPLSTYLDREGERIDGQCELRPDDGVVVEVG